MFKGAIKEWLTEALWGTWNWLVSFTFGFIPTWVWVLLGILALAYAYKKFGLWGLIGVGLFVLTAGAYRQGWRDRDKGVNPFFPVGKKAWPEVQPVDTPKAPKKGRNPKSLIDIFRERRRNKP